MNLVDRARNLIVTPRAEWSVIAGEQYAVHDLYTRYVVPLAAIPPVAGFIGLCIVGYPSYRVGIGAGVAFMGVYYLLTLVSVYLLALLVDAFAPTFGGQKHFGQALKVAAFAPTAAWLAGIFNILPALSILAPLGAIYSLYLLFTGLSPVMGTSEEKSIPYAAVVVIAAIVLNVLIAAIANLAIPSPVRGF